MEDTKTQVLYKKIAAGPDGVFRPGQTRIVSHKEAIVLAEGGAVEFLEEKTTPKKSVKKSKIEFVSEENEDGN